jgi:DNA repair protein RecN (Recombination protein N)
MLAELDIRDFALIEHVRVDWTSGLNVLTGETGAGKSIIIDALNAVLGGKVGPAAIRNGAERAVIEATFKQTAETAAWLKQQELQNEDLDGLVVSREVGKAGSRARINGTLVNLTLVQELRTRLITIHAQHEARTLVSWQSQLEMLDGRGDRAHEKLREKVATLHARRKELRQQLDEMQLSEEERLRRLDFARFQLKELDEASLTDHCEDDTVTGKCRVLANVAELEACAFGAFEALTGSERAGETSAADLVSTALSHLDTAAGMDRQLAPLTESLQAALDTIEEVARAIRRYRDGLDSDPDTLNALETRLAVLTSVKRKYGPTLAEAIARRDQLGAEVDALDNADKTVHQLTEELAEIEKEQRKLAGDLAKRRRVLAEGFSAAVQRELADLSMERCRFEVGFENSEIGLSGGDRVEFMIAPNPGQPLLPLGKIASGGELSRVMLAIKSIVAGSDRVPTVVFDEIDTGLSGRALQSMRDKLAKLAGSHQILCITHQPMIASVAANHLQVSKHQSDNDTHVTIAALGSDARIRSLADMAGGSEQKAEALGFARSLFEEGERLRKT